MAAGAGTLDDNADGTFVLTLTDVDRRVTAFTDCPDRDVLPPSLPQDHEDNPAPRSR